MLMFFGLCARHSRSAIRWAMTLAGVGRSFAGIGSAVGAFDPAFLEALPNRVFGTMSNDTLGGGAAVRVHGADAEQRARIAERLLATMGALFGGLRGGLAISVMLAGAVLAASTGIVGATVTTMGLIALPTMLRYGYDARLASGTICAAGTLGQIIPPSVILVLLGDVLSNAYQQAQLKASMHRRRCGRRPVFRRADSRTGAGRAVSGVHPVDILAPSGASAGDPHRGTQRDRTRRSIVALQRRDFDPGGARFDPLRRRDAH